MKTSDNQKKTWHIGDVLKWTTNYLRVKGCGTPRLDAEILLAHALKKDRLGLYLSLDQPLTEGERVTYRELVRRRASREPVALLVGRKEFWSLDILIRPGVLIPRPDTEILVEVVLEECRKSPACKVLEVGSGSGAVVCALCTEAPDIDFYACDISKDALTNTLANINLLRLSDRASIFASDLFGSIRIGPVFDIILSNPPYIPSGSIEQLEPEVRVFEPVISLDGGPDGLDVIRKLVKTSRHFLKPKGKLIIEIGEGQSDAASKLLFAHGFSVVEPYADLDQKIRVLKGIL